MNASVLKRVVGRVRAGSGRTRPENASERHREGDWPCDVCHEWRPDARISVYSTWVAWRGVEIRQNVKYCNDRPGCVAGAPHAHWIKEKP